MTRPRKKKARTTNPPPGAAPPALPKTRFRRVRPWLLGAATALFVARPLFPSESFTTGDGIGVVLAWILLAAIGFLEASRPEGPFFRWTISDALLAAFLSWAALSGTIAAMSGHARPFVNTAWEWTGLLFAFFLIRQFLVGAREVRALVAVMVAVGVGLSSYALYQYAVELPRSRAEYRANPDQVLRKAGLWYPPGSPERQLFESRLGSEEPHATFALTNSLAGFLAPWFVITIGIACAIPRNGDHRCRWWRPAVCLVPMAICLWLTHSRAAIGATLIGLGTLILHVQRNRISRKRFLASVAAAAVSAAVLLAIAGTRTRILEGAAKSLGYRLEYWYSSALLIADRPLLGCGPGGFQAAYTAHKLPRASEEVADPHNFLVEIAATTGLPGLLLFCGAAGCIAFTLLREEPRKDIENGAEAPVYWGALGGVVLSVPLGLLSSAPAGLISLAVGVPFAAGALWLLSNWVSTGELPPRLLALGAFVLAINLLAAGGITFPGVAGTLWLLLGMGIWSLKGSRPLPKPAAGAGLALACILIAVCYLSAYKPNIERAMHVDRALEHPAEAAEHLRKAAEADPLSADPWQKLASLYFQIWEEHRDPANWERFAEATQAAFEKDPTSAPFFAVTGERYLRAAEEGADKSTEFAEVAVSAMESAVRLYPNDPTNRAWLALALEAAGRPKEARHQADVARNLSELTPHRDKKLPAELRKRLPK